MLNLPFVLVVLAIIVTIVTLVGHGIWVLLATIFGGGRKKASQNCPFCGHSTPADRERCDWCGKQLTNPAAKELNDLAAVRRQLQRFRQNGTLKPEAVDRLLDRLQTYRQRLLQPAEEKRAAPVVAALIVEEPEPERTSAAPPVVPRRRPSDRRYPRSSRNRKRRSTPCHNRCRMPRQPRRPCRSSSRDRKRRAVSFHNRRCA